MSLVKLAPRPDGTAAIVYSGAHQMAFTANTLQESAVNGSSFLHTMGNTYRKPHGPCSKASDAAPAYGLRTVLAVFPLSQTVMNANPALASTSASSSSSFPVCFRGYVFGIEWARLRFREMFTK